MSENNYLFSSHVTVTFELFNSLIIDCNEMKKKIKKEEENTKLLMEKLENYYKEMVRSKDELEKTKTALSEANKTITNLNNKLDTITVDRIKSSFQSCNNCRCNLDENKE